MEISYRSSGINNYLEVLLQNDMGEPGVEVRYQLSMLEKVDVTNIIKPRINEINMNKIMVFNTSNLYVFERMLFSTKVSGGILQALINSISTCAEQLGDYLLDVNSLVLDSRYMFYHYKQNIFRFVYIPDYNKDIRLQLKDILEDIMKKFDHKDNNGVMQLYSLYERITEEDFSIDELAGYTKKSDMDITRDSLSTQFKDGKSNENESVLDEYSQSKIAQKLTPLTNGRLSPLMLDKFPIVIGRSRKDCSYRIDSEQISKVHAKISKVRDSIYIEDMGSTNGTYVDGKVLPVNMQLPVYPGSIIAFATEEFFIS